MKIYTEEQVRNLLEKMCLATEKNNLGVSANFRHRAIEINKLINSQTPIELPSDEDVEKMRKAYIEHVNIIVHKDLERDGYLNIAFLKGAKCVIDKIQGGNK